MALASLATPFTAITNEAKQSYTLGWCAKADKYHKPQSGLTGLIKGIVFSPFPALIGPGVDAIVQTTAFAIKATAWTFSYTAGLPFKVHKKLPEDYNLGQMILHVVRTVVHLANIGFFALGWPVRYPCILLLELEIVAVIQRKLTGWLYPSSPKEAPKIEQESTKSESDSSIQEPTKSENDPSTQKSPKSESDSSTQKSPETPPSTPDSSDIKKTNLCLTKKIPKSSVKFLSLPAKSSTDSASEQGADSQQNVSNNSQDESLENQSNNPSGSAGSPESEEGKVRFKSEELNKPNSGNTNKSATQSRKSKPAQVGILNQPLVNNTLQARIKQLEAQERAKQKIEQGIRSEEAEVKAKNDANQLATEVNKDAETNNGTDG